MKHSIFFYVLLTGLLFGCDHQKTPVQLSCIIMGPDSIIYYHGSSSHMQDIKRGVRTDTAFMGTLFHTIKEEGYVLTLKPSDGPEVLANFKEVASLANNYGVYQRAAVIDSNEEKAFGVATAPPVESVIKGEDPTFKLNLPKDEIGHGDSVLNKIPKTSQLIVLVAGDEGLYAYQGDNMQQGKKYSYGGMTEMLKTKAIDKDLFVVLRPSANCSYKNTVDALDMMKTAGIEQYGLFDIKKEEEDYLRQMYR